MGILGLMKFIADNAPDSIKVNTNNLFGRKIAIDASMALYQFLIAIRTDDMNSFSLTNDVGETTSHISGIFYRTVKMIDKGIKPIYVFDGKPPKFKSGELAKRTKRKKDALEAMSEARDLGDQEALAKAKKRSVSISKEQIEDAKRLLRLMGIPVIEAPCEADSQCVALVKEGICFAVGTEDMDTLTLGTTTLIRHLGYAESRKKPILEISLEKVLSGLEIDMDQFIDLCILFGCDYCEKIHGIGPKTAFQLIKKHKNIEEILKHLDTEKYKVPENYNYLEARELFKNPEIKDCKEYDTQIKEPDIDGIINFMVKEKGFSIERIQKGLDKLKKSFNSLVQGRITSFFLKSPSPSSSPTSSPKKDVKKKDLLPPTKKRKIKN